jgi:hypothetical protein
MKQISFEDGTDLMAAGVPDDGMRSWWDGIGESESGCNSSRLTREGGSDNVGELFTPQAAAAAAEKL